MAGAARAGGGALPRRPRGQGATGGRADHVRPRPRALPDRRRLRKGPEEGPFVVSENAARCSLALFCQYQTHLNLQPFYSAKLWSVLLSTHVEFQSYENPTHRPYRNLIVLPIACPPC